MTKNQLTYYQLVEQRRSNLAQEGLKQNELSETNRHNVASENFNLASLSETSRHNLAQEKFNLSSLAETTRHNQAAETETQRHNKSQELISQTQNVQKAQELAFNKQKEEQRIAESLRDYQETVRNHNLQALTSKTTAQLLATSGLSGLFSKVGVVAATAASGVGQSIASARDAIISRLRAGIPGAQQLATEFVTAVGKYVTNLPLVLDQITDNMTNASGTPFRENQSHLK